MDNLETMSMDELRALVEQNMGEQPRDDQGRFATAEPNEKEAVKPSVEEEVVYERRIDLGDGSGVQIFEGKTLEELVDKLAEAQKHATRKIREQAAALKTPAKPAPVVEEVKPLSDADRWLLQQRMLNEPEKVIEEFVQRKVSAIEQARLDREAAVTARQAEIERTANEWVAANPDYFGSEKNGAKIEKWLKTFDLEPTHENFTKAFQDLNESGLLEGRPKETPAETEEEPEPVKRIVEPAPVATTVRRKVVGGVSTKRSVEPTPGPTEDELYKLPMDQLEQMMLRHFRA